MPNCYTFKKRQWINSMNGNTQTNYVNFDFHHCFRSFPTISWQTHVAHEGSCQPFDPKQIKCFYCNENVFEFCLHCICIRVTFSTYLQSESKNLFLNIVDEPFDSIALYSQIPIEKIGKETKIVIINKWQQWLAFERERYSFICITYLCKYIHTLQYTQWVGSFLSFSPSHILNLIFIIIYAKAKNIENDNELYGLKLTRCLEMPFNEI